MEQLPYYTLVPGEVAPYVYEFTYSPNIFIYSYELRQIATSDEKFFEVPDFSALKQIIVSIRNLICRGKL